MRAAKYWQADNWADFLPNTLGISQPPVDLYAIARNQRVKRLGFRFIIPRGLLLPVEGGFEVYLRDQNRKDFDILGREPKDLLSPRQRFSLAHEIAHTLFYKFSDSVPAPDDTVSNGSQLENICNRTAMHILVPTCLLKREVDDYEKIDATIVRWLAARFRTSLTVIIERLSIVHGSNPSERCILLLRRVDDDAEIRAIYLGIGLLRTLQRPNKYTRLSQWLRDFPRGVIERREEADCTITRMGRPIRFVKTELGSSGDFLMQVDVLPTPTASRVASHAKLFQSAR
jgi:hypothetical protein